MKFTTVQGLLCVLIGALTVGDTNTRSATPRYYNYNGENSTLENSNFDMNVLSKISKTLPNSNSLAIDGIASRNLMHALFAVDKSRNMRGKVEKYPVNSNLVRNTTKFNKTNVIRISNTVLRKQNTIKNKTIFDIKTVNEINKARPKVKYKTKVSTPLKASTVRNSTFIEGTKKVENIQAILFENRIHKPKPLNSTVKLINPQSAQQYRNYTKFRIKPSYQQTSNIFGVNPQISTYSPEFPISSSSPAFLQPADPQTVSSNVNPEIYRFPPQYIIANSVQPPISQVILQTLPTVGGNLGEKDSLETNCPSFMLASNVFSHQRQGCSDLNVAINSYYNQNMIPAVAQPLASDPSAVEIAEPLADEPVQAAVPPAVEYPAAPAAAPATAPVAPASSTGSQGGTGGGLPQLPQLPGLPDLGFPDLKGLFDLLGFLWRIVSSIFGFLANPYLYLVPAGISFTIGFLKIVAAFKVFVLIPAILLFGYVNRDKPPEVVHYKHVHKPIHHQDGWFWNHNTKTWNNVANYTYNSKHSSSPQRSIDNFPLKYKEND